MEKSIFFYSTFFMHSLFSFDHWSALSTEEKEFRELRECMCGTNSDKPSRWKPGPLPWQIQSKARCTVHLKHKQSLR